MKLLKSNKGFTLIELLIVIGIIAVLAGVVLVAINPAAQFGKANDAERKAEISSVLSSVYQFQTSPSSRGALPQCTVNSVATTIPTCDTDGLGDVGNGLYEGAIQLGNVDAVGVYNCTGVLTPNFIREMPVDPSGTAAASAYHVCQIPESGSTPTQIYVITTEAEVFTDDGGCSDPGSTIAGAPAMCISG